MVIDGVGNIVNLIMMINSCMQLNNKQEFELCNMKCGYKMKCLFNTVGSDDA